MKRLAAIATFVIMTVSMLAPLSKVDAAWETPVLGSNTGMEVRVPRANDMKGGKFKLNFLIKLPYTDANGTVQYRKEFDSVNWKINGCGLNTDINWNRTKNYQKLSNKYPNLIRTALMPSMNECVLFVDTTARTCGVVQDGKCVDQFQDHRLKFSIYINYRPDAVVISGDDIDTVKLGSTPVYSSEFKLKPIEANLIDKSQTYWFWEAKTRTGTGRVINCSRPTSHITISPDFKAIIRTDLKTPSTCTVKASGVYSYITEGVDSTPTYVLNYVQGTKNITVVK